MHYEQFATHTHTLGILAICCYLLTKCYNGMGECIFRGSNSPEGIRKWGSPLILAGLQWEVPTQAPKKGQLPVPQGQSMSAPWFIKYMARWVFEFRLEIGMPPVLPLGCQVLQTCLRSPGTTLDRSWSGFEDVNWLVEGFLRRMCVCDLSRWFWDVLDSGGLFAAITAQVLRIWFGKSRFPSPSGYLTQWSQCNKYLT